MLARNVEAVAELHLRRREALVFPEGLHVVVERLDGLHQFQPGARVVAHRHAAEIGQAGLLEERSLALQQVEHVLRSVGVPAGTAAPPGISPQPPP